MFKKFPLIVLLLILCLSLTCFAIETFEYNNIVYTIDLVYNQDLDSSELILTATDYVDSTSVNPPPETIDAVIIYELLGYDDSEMDPTAVSAALANLGTAPLSVIKGGTLSTIIDSVDGGGGYIDESGMFIPVNPEETVSSDPTPIQAPSEDEIKVILTEQLTSEQTTVSFPDQKPVLVNDRTMIPARGVFEQLGYTVDWDEATSTAIVSSNNITVKIPINSSIIYKNDNEITLDVPAQLIGGRTMLPLRAVSTALGLQVEWDEPNNSVIIYY